MKSEMIYNLERIHEEFQKVKFAYDFTEYLSDMQTNQAIIHSCPFDYWAAQKQLSNMTTKYRNELNRLANAYNNGRFVVSYSQSSQTPQLNSQQLIEELSYINQHIPLFALQYFAANEFHKKVFSETLHKCEEKEFN